MKASKPTLFTFLLISPGIKQLIKMPIAYEVDGRFFLLPKLHFERTIGSLTSLKDGRLVVRDDNENIRKIDVNELMQLLGLNQIEKIKEETAEVVAKPVRDSTYYLDTVAFEVEKSIYVVPMQHFLSSTIFNAIGGIEEARIRNYPICLNSILKSDFLAFLKIICPPPRHSRLTLFEWLSVFKLATKWQIFAMRHLALENLKRVKMSPSERICLGIELKVPNWQRSGYIELANREDALSVYEFQRIGMDHALRMSQKIRRLRINSEEADTFDPQSTPFRLLVQETFGRGKDTGTTVKGDVVDRILRARENGVTEWILDGYADLARRAEDITVSEAEKLGLEVTVDLCRLRERVKDLEDVSDHFCADEAVSRVFHKELNETLIGAKEYGDYRRPTKGTKKLWNRIL